MRSRSRLVPRLLGALVVLVVPTVVLAVGCGSDDHGAPPPAGDASATTPVGGGCGTETGCPCSTAGLSIECRALRKSGSYVACSIGTRVCGADLRWGECDGDKIFDPDASAPLDTGIDADSDAVTDVAPP